MALAPHHRPPRHHCLRKTLSLRSQWLVVGLPQMMNASSLRILLMPFPRRDLERQRGRQLVPLRHCHPRQ